MFEETVTVVSFLASMNSWLTPTVLFLVLNIMIGTIAVTSGFGSAASKSQTEAESHEEQRNLAGSPSVLQRLKSINFYAYKSEESIAATTSVTVTASTAVERSPDLEIPPRQSHVEDEEPSGEVEVEVEGEEPTMDQVYSRIQGSFFGRSKSETIAAIGEASGEPSASRIMNRSVSDASAFTRPAVEETVERRRPATVREGESRLGEDEHGEGEGTDDEWDAKAENFIVRFREQLKLQRMASYVREN